jgi:hypothetical protein
MGQLGAYGFQGVTLGVDGSCKDGRMGSGCCKFGEKDEGKCAQGRRAGGESVSAWQAAVQVPRVPGRGGSCTRGEEGTGGAGDAGEGEEGQDDAAEDEMPA